MMLPTEPACSTFSSSLCVQPYLHESRHQHAQRRARGCGGRFLNTKQKEEIELKQKGGEPEGDLLPLVFINVGRLVLEQPGFISMTISTIAGHAQALIGFQLYCEE